MISNANWHFANKLWTIEDQQTRMNFSLLDLRYVRQCTFRNVVFVSYHFFLIFLTCRNSCQFFSLVPLIITTNCKSLSFARKVEFSTRSRDILSNQEDLGLRKFSSSIFSFFIYENHFEFMFRGDGRFYEQKTVCLLWPVRSSVTVCRGIPVVLK